VKEVSIIHKEVLKQAKMRVDERDFNLKQAANIGKIVDVTYYK